VSVLSSLPPLMSLVPQGNARRCSAFRCLSERKLSHANVKIESNFGGLERSSLNCPSYIYISTCIYIYYSYILTLLVDWYNQLKLMWILRGWTCPHWHVHWRSQGLILDHNCEVVICTESFACKQFRHVSTCFDMFRHVSTCLDIWTSSIYIYTYW
jgi:hypothetical protein